MSKKPVSASGVINMKGTKSKDAAIIYRGILDYYTGLSGLEITIDQITKRDKFVKDAALICDDSLDAQVLSLQDEFVNADGDAAKQKVIVEQVIEIL